MTLHPSRYNTSCRRCKRSIDRGDLCTGGKGRSICEACSRGRPEPKPQTELQRPACTEFGPHRQLGAMIGFDNGVHTLGFDSVGAAVQDLLSDHAENESNRLKISRDILSHSGTSWLEGKSPLSLRQLLQYPERAILDAIERMKAEITADVQPIEVRRRRRRGCDFGDEIDADRFLARDPMMWERIERQPTAKRTVWLGVNVVVHHKQTADELLWRGAAVVALADRLTMAGHSVGIVWMRAARRVTSHVPLSLARIILKSPDAPLDIAAVATACCDLGFNRLVGIFGAARHLPGIITKRYGVIALYPPTHRPDVDYFIDADVNNRASAIRWLRGCIEQSAAA